ncbi:MAG: hypothetical protein NDI94_03965 [Candidatus Woesearchaeota archaeon]|nr:hypothetical protein [Candidatus Woesearchaeota archaeon]
MKKGQVSYFVIIGIIAVLLVGAVVFNMNRGKGEFARTERSENMELDSAKDQLQSIAQSCFSQMLSEGIKEFGLRPIAQQAIGSYIDLNLGTCIELNLKDTPLGEMGYVFSVGIGTASVEIGENSVYATIEKPMLMKKDESSVELNKLSSKYIFSNEYNVKVDSSGRVEEDVLIEKDGISIAIKQGTEAVDYEGNPLSNLDVKIIDKFSNGKMFGNKVVVGMTMFEVSPARFNPPIIVDLKVSESDIPEGFSIDQIVLGYEDENGIYNGWVPLSKEQFEENGEKYWLIKTSVPHFTKVGALRCSDVAKPVAELGADIDPDTYGTQTADIKITEEDLKILKPTQLPERVVYRTPCGTLDVEYDETTNPAAPVWKTTGGTCKDLDTNAIPWKITNDLKEIYVDSLMAANIDAAKNAVAKIEPIDYNQYALDVDNQCIIKDYDKDDQTVQVFDGSVELFDTLGQGNVYFENNLATSYNAPAGRKREYAYEACEKLVKKQVEDYYSSSQEMAAYYAKIKQLIASGEYKGDLIHDALDASTCKIGDDGMVSVTYALGMGNTVASMPSYGYTIIAHNSDPVESYRSSDYPMGYYEFYASENGGSCVIEKEEKADMKVYSRILDSKDTLTNVPASGSTLFSLNSPWNRLTEEVTPNDLWVTFFANHDPSVFDDLEPFDPETDTIVAGNNIVYSIFYPTEFGSTITVPITDPAAAAQTVTGCYVGIMGVEINGIGFSTERRSSSNDCTVQERINYLLGANMGPEYTKLDRGSLDPSVFTFIDKEVKKLVEFRDSTPDGRDASLGSVPDYVPTSINGVRPGCGKEEFTPEELVAKDKCHAGMVGWYCDSSFYYKCNGVEGGLVGSGQCPTLTDAPSESFCSVTLDRSQYYCVNSNQVGCIDKEGNPITHDPGEGSCLNSGMTADILFCINGEQRSKESCDAGYCFTTSSGSYVCANDKCASMAAGDKFCRDPATLVTCAAGSPTPVSTLSACPTGSICDPTFNICKPQQPSCAADAAGYYCLNYGVSGQIYKCEGGNIDIESGDGLRTPKYVCDGNKVCMADGVAALEDGLPNYATMCQENSLYDRSMCVDAQGIQKFDGYYCEATGVSSAYVQCVGGKVVGNRQFCDNICYSSGTTSADKSTICTMPQNVADALGLGGVAPADDTDENPLVTFCSSKTAMKYYCSEVNTNKLVYCSADANAPKEYTCPEGNICTDLATSADNPGALCKPKAEAICLGYGLSGSMFGCIEGDPYNYYQCLCNQDRSLCNVQPTPCTSGSKCEVTPGSGYKSGSTLAEVCIAPQPQATECTQYGLVPWTYGDYNNMMDNAERDYDVSASVKCKNPGSSDQLLFCNSQGKIEVQTLNYRCYQGPDGKFKYLKDMCLGSELDPADTATYESGDLKCINSVRYSCNNGWKKEEGVLCSGDGTDPAVTTPGCPAAMVSGCDITVSQTFQDAEPICIDSCSKFVQCMWDSASNTAKWEVGQPCSNVDVSTPELCNAERNKENGIVDPAKYLNYWTGTLCSDNEVGWTVTTTIQRSELPAAADVRTQTYLGEKVLRCATVDGVEADKYYFSEESSMNPGYTVGWMCNAPENKWELCASHNNEKAARGSREGEDVNGCHCKGSAGGKTATWEC